MKDFAPLCLSFVVATACSASPKTSPVESRFVSVTARPLARTTAAAVEVVADRDAREVEAEDPIYLGELVLRPASAARPTVPARAAEAGATHFQSETSGETLRVVLFRVEPDRWPGLPEALQPSSL